MSKHRLPPKTRIEPPREKLSTSLMFTEGEDLPIFTGQAPFADITRFDPQEVVTLISMFDMRPQFGTNTEPTYAIKPT